MFNTPAKLKTVDELLTRNCRGYFHLCTAT